MNAREDLVRHYQWLRRYGLNDSHSGNASLREGELVWVTPTGAAADTLQASELVRCDLHGHIGGGASLDAPLHVMVYQKNPDARAVLHSHCPYTVALTMNGEDFVPEDFEGHYYFPQVPVITIAHQEYLREAPLKVAELLADYRVVVVRGHGVYAQAESIDLAYKWSCSVEQSAKTAWLARLAHPQGHGYSPAGT
ncbi:MAG TPA: class II aldolase/adducin family protein [Gammaproteobacteria bacterium]|nr:class II aldolase/adducin family protein [Gammaproteobacteria bacterium]